MLTQGDWDVVVIQAQSQEPALPTSYVYSTTLESSRYRRQKFKFYKVKTYLFLSSVYANLFERI